MLSPSALAADFCHIGQQLDILRRHGVKMLHIDVMDGMFVPNISMGTPFIKSLRNYDDIILDTHLMILRPDRLLNAFVAAGADIVNIHVEASADIAADIATIRNLGKKAALTVKPMTDVEIIYPYLNELTMVLIMSVEPGFGGQAFLPETLKKAESLANYTAKHNINIDIEMDGGINLDNVRSVINSGVNVIVAGTAIFGGDIDENVEAFMDIFKSCDTVGNR